MIHYLGAFFNTFPDRPINTASTRPHQNRGMWAMIRPPWIHCSKAPWRIQWRAGSSWTTNHVSVSSTVALRTFLDTPIPGAYNPAKLESRIPIGESSSIFLTPTASAQYLEFRQAKPFAVGLVRPKRFRSHESVAALRHVNILGHNQFL
jgi:hypothetical protein